MINVRQKGQEGEREVADALNVVILRVLDRLGIPRPPKPVVQRNQNQSAVGGSDLANTFNLAIEIKRQEQLAINTWWDQCTKAAKENPGDTPVLVFRQNAKPGQRTKWRVLMMAMPCMPHGRMGEFYRVEFSWEDFLKFFEHWVTQKISDGEMPRV
jgi:hypothetical protein